MKPSSIPLNPAAPTVSTAGPRLELLGAPRVIDVDGSVTMLGSRLAPLLSLLAIGGPLDRGQAALWLYPKLEASEARRNLRQLLHKQRALLGRLIGQQGNRLSLAAEVTLDLKEADTSIGSRTACLLGDLDFEDLPQFQQWLSQQRDRQAAAWRERVASAAHADEAAGRFGEALERAELLVLDHPTSEHAHRRVMRLHYLRGDRSSALEAFDRCERTLKDELSARPDAETLALLAQIESGQLARAASAIVPAAVLRPPRLVGRDREWQALTVAWASGRTIALTGEAGMGKSRLLGDFMQTRGDAAIVAVSARPGDERMPNALLTRLLRALLARRDAALSPGVQQELVHLLPELGVMSHDRPSSPTRFVNAVETVVGEAVGRGLEGIALDDLHFADPASIEVAERVAALGSVRFIVAFRDGELDAAAARFVANLAASSTAESIALEPLDVEAVHALLVSLAIPSIDPARWAAALQRRSGGNPQFLLETVKAVLMDTAPAHPASPSRLPVAASLAALIQKRITALSPAAVRLARCAAVAGQDFSAELAAHVLATAPIDLADGWSELEAAQVLRDGAFTHDLIYEAALASVPKPIARQLHGEIARFLVAASAAPIRIAPHADAAGLHDLAAVHWRAAGTRAHLAGRLIDAQDFHSRAAGAYAQLKQADEVFESRRAAVAARSQHLDDDEAQTLLLQLENSAVTPTQRMAALSLRVHFLGRHGRFDEAVECGRIALDQARDLADPREQLLIACRVAHAWSMLNQPQRGLDLLQPFELWVVHEASVELRADYFGHLGQMLTSLARLDESIRAFDLALAAARESGRYSDVADLIGLLAEAHHKAGRATRARDLCRSGNTLTLEQAGGMRTTNLLTGEFMLAKYLVDLGQYAEALELAGGVATFYRDLNPYWARGADVLHAIAFVHLGQYARVAPLLERGSLSDNVKPIGIGLRCEMSLALGTADIGDLLDEADRLLKDSRPGPVHAASIWRSRVVEPDEAADRLDEAIAYFEDRRQCGTALAARVRAADVACSRNRLVEARRHVDGALELLAEHAAPIAYRGETWLVAHRVFEAVGDHASARKALEDGLDWLRITLTHVPSPFRPSFLERNRYNRQLLEAARRHGLSALQP